MPGVFLALDYGTKRIGIAVSTSLGTVHPRPRLLRTTPDEDLEALCALIEESEAEAIVMGLPHNMDGSESEMEREVRAFAKELAKRCPLPVFGTDERLTSEAAASILGTSRAAKEKRDSAAACIFLQDYLTQGELGEQIA
ncbi:MAG: Holliday junction resolvase RuvX [Planctomycetota bacterium]